MPAYQQPTVVNHAYAGAMSVDHKGKRYYFTHKQGTNIKTGLPSSEYEASDGARVYLIGNGADTYIEAE